MRLIGSNRFGKKLKKPLFPLILLRGYMRKTQ